MGEILGVALPTIDAWRDQGMPYAVAGAKGRPWEFETKDVIEWFAREKYQNRDGRVNSGRPTTARPQDDPFAGPGDMLETEDEAKARKERALADLRELEAATAAGLVVPIEDIKAVVTEEHTRVRTRILEIPNKLRPRLSAYLNNDRKAVEEAIGVVESTIVQAFEQVQAYVVNGGED